METIVSDEKKRKKICNTLINRIENDKFFNMGYWSTDVDTDDDPESYGLEEINECGTVRCIGGLMKHLIDLGEIDFPKDVERLGCNMMFYLTGNKDCLNYDKTNLFYPEIESKYHLFTKEEALKTLKHFRETGIVNWEV